MQSSISRRGDNVFLRIGRNIYTYNVKSRPLGSGAMGVVFLGRDVSNHHSIVAIKMVNPKYTHLSAVRNRARIEASYCFNHDNLIEMLGCCEDGTKDGPVFIVSKYVNGETLDKYVKNSMTFAKERTKQICQLIYPVLDALNYLHSKEIMHLDVKPSNIMVENGCNVRLMDLGIAQFGSNTGKLNNGLYGTAGYAAPEQYGSNMNSSMTVSPATDIYAVGITLYELLYGCIPSDNILDIISKRKLNKVDVAVNNVIKKAISPIPQDRYQSASEMIAALACALKQDTNETKMSKYLAIVIIVLLIALLLILLVQ